MKKALITGITGQDGSYLAELLLEKGYEVHGVSRKTSVDSTSRIAGIKDRVKLHAIDLCDRKQLGDAVKAVAPDEIYNLASQSFIPASWENPALTIEANATVVAHLLDVIRNLGKKTRFYQASSSEMFGAAQTSPQNEDTPLRPRTPYGAAKTCAHFLVKNFREKHGVYAVSGILFNHESPRRGLDFVTRKVTDAVAKIKAGQLSNLHLGNLEAQRDWGYAKDYVDAMWRMLQQQEPEDFVIATGVLHTVRELLEIAFTRAGLDYQDYVVVDEKLSRPVDVANLCGDYARAKKKLNWEPRTSFKELIELMVDADLERTGVFETSNKRRVI